jgi:hypothetical protein
VPGTSPVMPELDFSKDPGTMGYMPTIEPTSTRTTLINRAQEPDSGVIRTAADPDRGDNATEGKLPTKPVTKDPPPKPTQAFLDYVGAGDEIGSGVHGYVYGMDRPDRVVKISLREESYVEDILKIVHRIYAEDPFCTPKVYKRGRGEKQEFTYKKKIVLEGQEPHFVTKKKPGRWFYYVIDRLDPITEEEAVYITQRWYRKVDKNDSLYLEDICKWAKEAVKLPPVKPNPLWADKAKMFVQSMLVHKIVHLDLHTGNIMKTPGADIAGGFYRLIDLEAIRFDP